MSSVRSSIAELDRLRLWHPFTQQADWARDDPLVIAAGEGSWVIDESGRRYLDGNASLWVNVHGHRRPEIDEAVREQLDRIAHTTFLGLTNPPAVAFADALLGTTPAGLTRAFLSESGSSACEVAIKLALRHAQLRGDSRRTRIVGLRNGYHGDTLGAVAAGGIDAFHAAFAPLLGPALHAPSPIDDPNADGLAALLDAHGDEVFALIVEPLIQAAAGILVAPEGWLARARALCDEAGCLLICDEVAVGLGRTGTFWACEREGVAPDILCTGKGLTGGYLPLSATLVREELYESFLGGPERTFHHGHSYSGNPLACAAAVASLALYERDGTLANVVRQSARLRSRLEAAPYPGRGHGLLLGVTGGGSAVCRAARRHGLVIRPLGEVVVVCPPLSISDEESDLLADALLAAYADAA
ncbi:MAG: adenosylmethionine---8-amino-7-oxononanoate aminotransferase [Gaiellales bacterium]|nr:adenosylmethionine---8-amino-7-oxononanoate aminotransferase [Gaiellales bacterium]